MRQRLNQDHFSFVWKMKNSPNWNILWAWLRRVRRRHVECKSALSDESLDIFMTRLCNSLKTVFISNSSRAQANFQFKWRLIVQIKLFVIEFTNSFSHTHTHTLLDGDECNDTIQMNISFLWAFFVCWLNIKSPLLLPRILIQFNGSQYFLLLLLPERFYRQTLMIKKTEKIFECREKCLINFSWWILMIFPRTFFPLHRCYLANSTTMLFIFICFTQKVVKWVVELMLHRGGADGVGRAFSSELFPSFLYEKRVFFASAFSIANNCENFQFPAAHSQLPWMCALLYARRIQFWFYGTFFSHRWLSTSQKRINNTNGCSRFR